MPAVLLASQLQPATGRAVFRLTELLEEKEYYEGRVEYLADDAYAPDQEQYAPLVQLFQKCHILLFSSPWLDDPEAEEATLAYRMAALLPVELEKRQALLEMRSERERRETMLRWMERFVPRLIAQQKTRERAGGNGHARN